MKKIYILLAVVAIGATLAVFLPRTSIAPGETTEPVVTTPAPVPTAGDISLASGQKGQLGVLGIIWNEPLQDSRCPVGAQCVWAGEVKMPVTLSLGARSETVTLTMGKEGFLFDGHKVSVVLVSPKDTPLKDFKVTFRVELVGIKK